MCSNSKVAVSVNQVAKTYQMYASPSHRLRQFFSGKKRKHFKEFQALKGISFELRQGETVGILGRNGSGKSTLLQIIAGTLNPSAGSVSVHGRLAALLELGSGFNPEFSGRENVYLNGAILGFSHQEMAARFSEIEAFADIGEHIDQPVKTYSSGMYVRLAFAVQACVEPQVLIVDEALSVGDEKFQRKCFDYIDALRQKGCAILLVTHSTATVEKFCQRAVLLHKGEMHGQGPAKEIVDQYHALLYSDEKTYLRYLNSQLAQNQTVGLSAEANEHASSEPQLHAASEQIEGDVALDDVFDAADSTNSGDEETSDARALIADWRVTDNQGQACEVFRSGEQVRIELDIAVMAPVSELQAGLLMRTVEGVPAFATSTLYYDRNVSQAEAGDLLSIGFELTLNLCEGTYFVTLAIAEAISHADMSYLDRRTDVVLLKVSEPRTLATGIANLPTAIDVMHKKGQH